MTEPTVTPAPQRPVPQPPIPQRPVAPLAARVLGAVGRSLITAGVVVLLFVVYQLWGTNLQEARSQNDLRSEFDGTFAAAQDQLAAFAAAQDQHTAAQGQPTTTEPTVSDSADSEDQPITTPVTLPGGFDPAVLEYFFPEGGDAVARIEIPDIDVEKIVVSGVQVSDLRKGPGQYPGAATAGTEGNTSVAGHRTTYGAPFNRIDELEPGDEIHVTGILGRFTYRVMTPEAAFPDRADEIDSQGAGHIIVRPDATWVLSDFGDNRLTLTACNPKLSSRQRIIVAAELVAAPVVAPAFDPEIVAAFIDSGDSEPELPGETQADPSLTDTSDLADEATDIIDSVDAPEGPAASLDEGLSGERDAIPGAVAWMMMAIAFWIGAGVAARRWFEERSRRVAVRFAGLVPTALCLWFSFELIDRALPAG